MRVLDLFSGIGGFSLGLERAGMETVAFCEFDKHARLVLEKHWPSVPIHEDVRQLDGHQYRETVDVICGGFPCQDISAAGNQAGLGEETRSGLWSECARLLGEVRPKYAIFENVTALISGDGGRWFQRVLWDISQVGYDAEWHCIPASELGAHHHRDRVWIVCYPNPDSGMECAKQEREYKGAEKYAGICTNVSDTASVRLHKRRERQRGICEKMPSGRVTNSPAAGGETMANPQRSRQSRQGELKQSLFAAAYREGKTVNALPGGQPEIWKTQSELGRVADGVPRRSHRLKQLGNAVCPPVVEVIGRAIMEFEHGMD